MPIHVDFSDTEVFEIGTYAGTITGKNLKDDPKNQGHTSIRVDVTLTEGPGVGRELSTFTNTTKKSAWKIKEIMEACGAKVEREMDVEDFFDNIEGTDVMVKIGLGDNNGVPTNEIQQFLKASSGEGRRRS